MKIDEREVAVYALTDILKDGGYNNIILRKTLQKNNAMEGKAFVTEVVNGVIRNLIYIDYVINSVSKTKTEKMKPLILNALRSAVYQINFLDAPDYAVVHETVKFVKNKGFGNLSGFVNGVLRAVCRCGINLPDKKSDLENYLSVKYSCPIWIIRRFLNDYGAMDTEKICESNNQPPAVSIHVNTLRTDRASLIDKLKAENVEVSDGILFENALKISKTSDITRLESFKEGLFHVMDESSMAAVYALNPAGGVLADCCGAPGGKSFLSAYLMGDSGEIHTADIYEHKVNLIISGAERLHIKSVKAYLHNAKEPDRTLMGKADYVIVDAPCSGLGLMRRKPDIKYTKQEKDILELQKLQREILTAASQYVKPGGILVYSTCTLTKEENTDNAAWFLNSFDFSQSEIDIKVKDGDKHTISILPFEYGTDGFFISKFKRN